MQLFYLYFWITVFFPTPFLYAGYYLIFLVIYMIPVSIILHLAALIYGRSIKDKKIVKINTIGLIICAIYIIVILFLMYW